jgi:hypothetical protein
MTNERKRNFLEIGTFIIGVLSIITTMFNEEIRDLIFTSWRTVLFSFGVIMLLFSIMSVIMRRMCSYIVKSEFGEVVENNKQMQQLIELKEKGIKSLYNHEIRRGIINYFLIEKTLLDKLTDDELFEVCKEITKKWNVPYSIDNEKKTAVPNFRDYGIRESVLLKLEKEYFQAKLNNVKEKRKKKN